MVKIKYWKTGLLCVRCGCELLQYGPEWSMECRNDCCPNFMRATIAGIKPGNMEKDNA